MEPFCVFHSFGFFFFFFKTSPHLLPLFRRISQCYFAVKLQKCFVDLHQTERGELIMTTFSFSGDLLSFNQAATAIWSCCLWSCFPQSPWSLKLKSPAWIAPNQYQTTACKRDSLCIQHKRLSLCLLSPHMNYYLWGNSKCLLIPSGNTSVSLQYIQKRDCAFWFLFLSPSKFAPFQLIVQNIHQSQIINKI